ncbi:MAG TPA: AAA family ATPase [Kofleriaceae bacterium]|nr:AAA family ATPase [Kofleriaceae bacterium]
MTEPPHKKPSSRGAENAYFLSLSLGNIRCFAQEQRLNLERSPGIPARWTLILGDNGVGKTTLMQLLALGAAMPRHTTVGMEEIGGAIPRLAYALWLPELTRSGQDLSRVDYSVLWSRSLYQQESSEPDKSAIWWDANTDVRTFDEYREGKESVIYGYGANRRRAPKGLTAETSDNPVETLFDDDATLRNPEEWLLQNELVANTGSPLQDRARLQRARVREILTRILPGIDDIRVIARAAANQQVRATAEVHGPDGWVPFSALGLGYRTMTAWIVDLASRLFERYGDLADPLSGAAVCLVDEIDLHLHPRWQRDLITRLTKLFPNTQFIATAHSPLVVQAAPDANVVVLKRQGDGVVIDNSPPSVRKWRVDQILTSELFDIPSARAPELDGLIRERDEILAKPVLSDQDKHRLEEPREEIGVLPHGDTPEDIEAMDLIRRAAKALKDRP